MKNLILVGGNRMLENEPIETLHKLTKRKKINLFVYTEKTHLNKKCENSLSFKKFLDNREINYKVSKNINNEINDLKKRFPPKSNSYLLLTNCIWKIQEGLIRFFKNKIFNIHIGMLPSQKGAGGASWLRMVNSKFSAVTIHAVEKELDTGKVLIEKKFKLKKNFSLLNYYNQTRDCEKITYNKFLNILTKKNFRFKKQKKEENIYMPRLDTQIHGFIDWNWTAKHIVDFINAFGSPYQGATTFIKKKKYFLNNAKFFKNKINFHPFQSGIIFRKEKNSIYIAALGGTIQIKKVSDTISKEDRIVELKLGSRFFTPLKELEKAKQLTSIHSSEGIFYK